MKGYDSYADNELFALLQEGDYMAFSEIYDRYKSLLYTHIFKRIGDREETKDILQELFSLLWYKRVELNLNNSLSGYLYKSVRNRMLNVIAHKKVQSSYVESLQYVFEQGTCTTDFLLRENELMSVIDREIAALPSKMRAVFELSRKENLSHKEIASQLGISEMTVKKHVNNALKVLRAKLGIFVVLFFV